MHTCSRVTEIDEVEAPWGRNVRVQEVEFEGGAVMLRVRIREGKRFTDLEMTRDQPTTGRAILSVKELISIVYQYFRKLEAEYSSLQTELLGLSGYADTLIVINFRINLNNRRCLC